MLTRRLLRVATVWTLLTLAWCAFVIVLAGRLHAQEPCPPGTISVDRYGFLCLPGTAEAFVDVAGWAYGSGIPSYLQSVARRQPRQVLAPLYAAATPRIILAHQKLASDAWTLAAQQRDEYQQWIHDNRPSCCDHRDCSFAKVEWTPHGWKVFGADNYVAERQVIAWPFSIPYACVINRYVRCLFLNSGG